MGGGIVQELDAGIESFGCAIGLLGGDGPKGGEHGVIDSTSIVEEDANNLLDKLDF